MTDVYRQDYKDKKGKNDVFQKSNWKEMNKTIGKSMKFWAKKYTTTILLLELTEKYGHFKFEILSIEYDWRQILSKS